MTRSRFDPETELLEHGPLRAFVPTVTTLADGRLEIGCAYGCPLDPVADVADAMRVMVAHTPPFGGGG